MTTVFLDSNIYRQFGQNFYDNQDFIRLKDFLDKTYNEFGILRVVEQEILDFLEVDIYHQIKLDYSKLKSRIDKNPFIESNLLPDIKEKIDEGLENAKKQLDIHKFRLGVENYSASELISFLLHNKRQNGKKDNTRDFLIAHDLLRFCQEQVGHEVALISDDEFFSTNKHVLELITQNGIENLHIFKNISDFLKDFGPQFDFVTEELVLSAVSIEDVRKELMKDIKCFPSYVSKFYYDKKPKDIPDLESLEIKDFSVHDFYVTKNLTSDTYTIQFSLEVPIKAIYQSEKNLTDLNNFRKVRDSESTFHHETFDKENRPIFDHKVLFIYEGVVNETEQSLDNVKFIDFFPDHFLWEEYKERIERERKTIPPEFLCADGEKHIFDTDHGFYKHSQYGGGLSWHYRCSKCGLLYDTGEYFD